MQTLDKIIIYDDDCPLCNAYTNLFVKTGLIKKENRKNFSTITPKLLQLIDIERSKNEIPVIELPTNKVYYGIDGLVEILSSKFSFIKPIVNAQPINWILKKIYKLISYNRRVIVATETTVCNFNCTPQFNVRYRLLFAFLFLLFNTILLFPLYKYVIVNSVFNNVSIAQFQIAHIALVAVNIGIALVLTKKDGIEFIGQVNMLATITILLFIPLMLLNKYQIVQAQVINNSYMVLLAGFVVKEYFRRMNFAEVIAKHKWIMWVNGFGIVLFLLSLKA